MRAIAFLPMLVGLAAAKHPTVYWIRHGEKPASGNGLDPQGVQRSQCLKNVFGPESPYVIGHIMAEQPKSDGSRQRPYDTVLPLSQELGLPVDTSCGRDDAKCVQNVIMNYNGTGNVLVCWEHGELTKLVAQLGDKKAPDYPGSSFDLIWTDPYPYKTITKTSSEDCPGLDGGSSKRAFRIF